jgi:hypothetical protein
MRLEDFWINCGTDLSPTELECSRSGCYGTVGEIDSGATLASVLAMAEGHRCVDVIDGEVTIRQIEGGAER